MVGNEFIYETVLPDGEKPEVGLYQGTYTYYILAYNLETGKNRVILSEQRGDNHQLPTSVYYYDRHLFLNQPIYDEVTGKTIPANLMLNIDTGKKTVIKLPVTSANVRAVDDNAIYYYISEASKYYKSDLDGNNVIEISANDLPGSIADDGNRYYHKKADVKYSLICRDEKDNEHLILEGNCGPHFVHDGWIYYTEQTAAPIIVGTDTEGNPLTTNAKHIWRISTDGKIKEIVYENDGLHTFSRLDMVMKAAGDYVGVSCNLYKVENGALVNLHDDPSINGFIIINGKTGETKCVEYSTDITRRDF
ncbi:MAG: DUF5050 domain-containing protein [Clostridia bacterium]|nr:DUF5050 domain-containing protein [Clostridia bacterium]